MHDNEDYFTAEKDKFNILIKGKIYIRDGSIANRYSLYDTTFANYLKNGKEQHYTPYNMNIFMKHKNSNSYIKICDFTGNSYQDGTLVFNGFNSSQEPYTPYVIHFVDGSLSAYFNKFTKSYGLMPPLESFMEQADGCLQGIWWNYIDSPSSINDEYSDEINDYIHNEGMSDNQKYKSYTRILDLMFKDDGTDEMEKAVEAISSGISCLLSKQGFATKLDKDIREWKNCFRNYDTGYEDDEELEYIKDMYHINYIENCENQYCFNKKLNNCPPYKGCPEGKCESCGCYNKQGKYIDGSKAGSTTFLDFAGDYNEGEKVSSGTYQHKNTNISVFGNAIAKTINNLKGIFLGGASVQKVQSQNLQATNENSIVYELSDPANSIWLDLADFSNSTQIQAFNEKQELLDSIQVNSDQIQTYNIDTLENIEKVEVSSQAGWVGLFEYSFNEFPPDGDVAPLGGRDGKTNVADALVCLRFALGLESPSQEDLMHGDVAPLNASSQPDPDGQITVADALVILRKALGLISF